MDDAAPPVQDDGIDQELRRIANLIRGRDELFYDDGPIGMLAGFVRTLAYVVERDRKELAALRAQVNRQRGPF